MLDAYAAPALHASDADLNRLIKHARRAGPYTDEALYAEMLDTLVRVSWNLDREDILSAAEDLVGIATKIRDRADADFVASQSKVDD